MNKARFLVLGVAALGLTTVLHSTLAYAVVLEETPAETTSEAPSRHAIATVKPSHSVAPGTGALSSGIVVVPPPKASTSTAPAHGPVTSGIATVPPKPASSSPASAGHVTSGIALVSPPKAATPSAALVAPSAAVRIPTQPVAAKSTAPPPPASPHTFKHGECPLTKDSSGTWRGPDGVAVDATTANMGDCKGHSK